MVGVAEIDAAVTVGATETVDAMVAALASSVRASTAKRHGGRKTYRALAGFSEAEELGRLEEGVVGSVKGKADSLTETGRGRQ